jgi:release factor glutamine methyltransferase
MPETITAVLHAATLRLTLVTPTPQLEAEVLLTHLLNQPRSYLHAHSNAFLPPNVQDNFWKLIARREQGEPIAYLTGRKEFWSLELKVTPATLIPRPETELLVEQVLDRFDQKKIIVADLGTGTGAIALALAQERPLWEIYATDQSLAALAVAESNAKQLALQSVTFLSGHWCQALPAIKFDVIVSNPPYLTEAEGRQLPRDLSFEPRAALVSGQEGLDAIEEISVYSVNCLKPGGFIFIEHGARQGAAVRKLLSEKGYTNIETSLDLAGLERVTIARS